MKLETLLIEFYDLKKEFERGKNLKLYCEQKNISYTSTSRILNKKTNQIALRSIYNILGLTPELNMSQVVLEMTIGDILCVMNEIQENRL
jgi:hypothetical protein